MNDAVGRYLDALAHHRWDDLAATLAPDVARTGPYGDEHHGRDSYAAFLRTTVQALPGYELVVDRVVKAGSVVVAELHETVDDGDARLRTHEAVVFDVHDDLIARVSVYLRSSQRIPPEPKRSCST